ncbi:T6SS immunity protein Tdi1 domain-containing protein [Lysobacter sp. Root667]|uniref:T6SS immunity protein Tdi1 domain-containing protein n=1 Tax=Lysobacter sp. Root667 TaxID=1736581 RepID=UPI0006FB6A74|nr:T6SS immunity protein Tdi1 domain-containing protein [Lysobacter sp. Root667]
MVISWKQLTFVPTPEALEEFRSSWGWFVPDEMMAFMAATSGDLFFEAADGAVHWLDTGRGELSRVAASRDEFLAAMRADGGNEWLMTPVVEELLGAGAVVGDGQCFGYKVLPILGGDYTADNMVPMSAVAWYGSSGWYHQQLHDLPDGTHVRLSVGE